MTRHVNLRPLRSLACPDCGAVVKTRCNSPVIRCEACRHTREIELRRAKKAAKKPAREVTQKAAGLCRADALELLQEVFDAQDKYAMAPDFHRGARFMLGQVREDIANGQVWPEGTRFKGRLGVLVVQGGALVRAGN